MTMPSPGLDVILSYDIIKFDKIKIDFLSNYLQKGRQPSYYFMNKFDIRKLLEEENELRM